MSVHSLKNYDLALLNHVEDFERMRIIIYGAGNCGRKIWKQLSDMGIDIEAFCDRDAERMGKSVENMQVLTLEEMEKAAEQDRLLVIIAIQDQNIAYGAHKILEKIEGIKIVSSYAALKAAYLYTEKMATHSDIESTMAWMKKWYSMQSEQVENLLDVIESSIIVYQNGKVGSSTLWHSILEAGVKCAHLHYIGKDDMVQYLICGENEYGNLADQLGFHHEGNLLKSYIARLREKQPLKIISLVREPISVDISTIFQFLSTDYLDRYLIKSKADFNTAIIELILKFQNRLFQWFDKELGQLFGINIYDYPFDKEHGYVCIKEEGLEIIILQLEKIKELENVIGEFIGRDNFKIKTFNQALTKEYRFIYETFLKEIKLPKDYVEFYYKNNKSMDYFYSKEIQELFLQKWKNKIA